MGKAIATVSNEQECLKPRDVYLGKAYSADSLQPMYSPNGEKGQNYQTRPQKNDEHHLQYEAWGRLHRIFLKFIFFFGPASFHQVHN